MTRFDTYIISEKKEILNLLIGSNLYWWSADWKIQQKNIPVFVRDIKDFDMIYNKFDVLIEVRILEKRNDWIGNPKEKWFDRDFIVDNL